MSNHPNRNWRARMQAAADQWLQTAQSKVLARVPYAGPQDAALRERLREAYLAGYQDGHKRES